MTPQNTFRTKNPDRGRSLATMSRTVTGFTLVEVLVSTILVTICLAAVASIVRVGTDLQVSDNNRRQARTLLRSTFEKEYGFRQYASIPDSALTVNTVDIDPYGVKVLKGELTKIIHSDSVSSVPGTRVPVKIITLTLRWNEPGMGSNMIPCSITMTKLLAAVQ
jgi:type II secretory pathway pseudopilin PulG